MPQELFEDMELCENHSISGGSFGRTLEGYGRFTSGTKRPDRADLPTSENASPAALHVIPGGHENPQGELESISTTSFFDDSPSSFAAPTACTTTLGAAHCSHCCQSYQADHLGKARLSTTRGSSNLFSSTRFGRN